MMKDFAFVEQKYYIVIAIALPSPDTSILVTDDDDTLLPVLCLLVTCESSMVHQLFHLFDDGFILLLSYSNTSISI